MSEKPLGKLHANLCGLRFCVSGLYAKYRILPIITGINDRESQVCCSLAKGVGMATLRWRRQLIIEIKNPILMDEVKCILVAGAETNKCFRVVVLLLQLCEQLRKLCQGT